jgi:hypothetical protein
LSLQQGCWLIRCDKENGFLHSLRSVEMTGSMAFSDWTDEQGSSLRPVDHHPARGNRRPRRPVDPDCTRRGRISSHSICRDEPRSSASSRNGRGTLRGGQARLVPTAGMWVHSLRQGNGFLRSLRSVEMTGTMAVSELADEQGSSLQSLWERSPFQSSQ